MAEVMLVRGIPEHIRSDNGPEMTAKIVWLLENLSSFITDAVGDRRLGPFPHPYLCPYCEPSFEPARHADFP